MAVPFILEILVKISDTKMRKNLYNKVDAEKWMIIQKLSEIHQTSFFNAANLVLFDPKILKGTGVSRNSLNFSAMFDEL